VRKTSRKEGGGGGGDELPCSQTPLPGFFPNLRHVVGPDSFNDKFDANDPKLQGQKPGLLHYDLALWELLGATTPKHQTLEGTTLFKCPILQA